MTANNNNNTQQSFGQKPIQSRYIMIRENIFQVLSSPALAVYMSLRFEGDYSSAEAPVKRNIKCLCNKARVKRSTCFEALKELESHGLLQRKADPGYQNMYLVAQDLGYFLPKTESDPPPNPPEDPIDQPPVRHMDEGVQNTDGVVQEVDTIINNLSTNLSHSLKPIVDSANTTKDYKEDLLFMEFYKNYPNKQKPAIAHKAFLKHKPDADFVAMIITDVLGRIEGNWKGRDKSKIPFPATYLNGREWEGEIFQSTDSTKSTNRPATKYRTMDEIIGGNY